MVFEDYTEEYRTYFAVELVVTVPITLISCIPMENFFGCSMINLLNALVLFCHAICTVYLRPFLLGFLYISSVLQTFAQAVGCLFIGIAFAAENPGSFLVTVRVVTIAQGSG
eukprot:Hpha_TRINITY_DN6206_c0_g1::TRINITY_DN6206_c0_g1_i1::g.23696::m.23696